MKIVHVLNINNYFPELCEITMPMIERYTKKIGAELNIIKKRMLTLSLIGMAMRAFVD